MSKPAADQPELDSRLLEASAEGALAAVAQLQDPERLIREWTVRGNAAAIQEVAEHGTGAARKAARRAINILKARGVKIQEARRVASLRPRAEPVHEAWMLAPDGMGNVLFALTARSPASRYQAVFLVLHEAAGIQRVELAEVSQSQLKDALAKAAPAPDCRPVRVPIEWARARIAAARKLHVEHGVPEPLGMTSAASLLEPVPSEHPPHPFDEEGLELADDDARELTRQSLRLHSMPEFRNWLPTRAAVDEMLAKVGELLTPGQEPDPAFLGECIEREVIAATDRYFSPQQREQLVRTMKDSALSVLQREGEVVALEVVSVIQFIERAGLITDPPHEIPFLRGFFDKAVSVLAAQGQGRLRIPMRAAAPGGEGAQASGEGAQAAGETPAAEAPQPSAESGA